MGKALLGLTAIMVVAATLAAVTIPLGIAIGKAAKETSTAAAIITSTNTNASSTLMINTTTSITTNTSTTATSTIASTIISSTITVSSTSTSVTTTTTTSRLPISLLATVTASGFYSSAGSAASQSDSLVDRTAGGSGLSIGAYPPQYVQLEFPGLYNITSVYLQVGQLPNGVTRHQLSSGANLTSLTLVADMNNYTSSGQWINITFSPPLIDVRFLRLDTLSGPSWVAWIKFIVYDV